jgi:hypothetical protein
MGSSMQAKFPYRLYHEGNNEEKNNAYVVFI